MTTRSKEPHDARPDTRAWQPAVDGLLEVFHARFVDHVYPAHTHDSWTLLIVDDGAISYGLDRHEHGALPSTVTLLPPHVAHDGRSATQRGFRKRVLYLDLDTLDINLIGPAVDNPAMDDALLRYRIHQLHQRLDHPGDVFEAESRWAMIRERLGLHLSRRPPEPSASAAPSFTPASHRKRDSALASQLRDLLDTRITNGITLREAALELHAHPTHLVRSFTSAFGLPPHLYVTGRRVDRARRQLLAGQRPADVATATGFYDQAHLNRHFRRYLGISPARYARSQFNVED